MKKLLLTVCLCLLAVPVAAESPKKSEAKPKKAAEKAVPPADPLEAEAAEFESQLEYQRGRIELPGGIATLNVPESFRYLRPEHAERLLVEAWGNPPGTKTLGMLVPSGISPLSQEGWGVVITYVEEGHVDDSDAGAIDYDELLKQMKEESAEDNKKRTEQGYDTIDVVGWARPPHYEQAAHKLYWARELSVPGAPEHTLNYDIRVLGRKGVLSFNAVSGMSKLGDVEGAMKEVMSFADFNPGHRYADFDSKVDNVAAYGIGALVAGKFAAKAGFFKVLLGFILAGKKFVFLAVIGIGALLVKLFKGRSE